MNLKAASGSSSVGQAGRPSGTGWFVLAAATGMLVAVVPVFAQPGGTGAAPDDPAARIDKARTSTPAQAEAALKQALNVQQIGPDTYHIGRVEFDKAQRTVILPASVHIRTQVVEYILVTESGKAYESLLTTDVRPADVHLAFLLLGVGPTDVGGDFNKAVAVPASNAVSIELSWGTNAPPVKYPLPELIVLKDELSGQPARPFPLGPWLYNGSLSDGLGFVAQREGSIVSLIRDLACLLNNPRDDRDNHHIHFPKENLLPPEGSSVRVILRLPPRAIAPSPPPDPTGAAPIRPATPN